MRTPLCDLLGIDAPLIQAALGPWSNAELTAAVSAAEGRGHELVPFTGQSVGLVRDVPSAAELVRGMVAGAAEALHAAGRLERAVQ